MLFTKILGQWLLRIPQFFLLVFKWVRISPEIHWFHYQGASLAPKWIFRHQTLIKTPMSVPIVGGAEWLLFTFFLGGGDVLMFVVCHHHILPDRNWVQHWHSCEYYCSFPDCNNDTHANIPVLFMPTVLSDIIYYLNRKRICVVTNI